MASFDPTYYLKQLTTKTYIKCTFGKLPELIESDSVLTDESLRKLIPTWHFVDARIHHDIACVIIEAESNLDQLIFPHTSDVCKYFGIEQ